MLLIWEVQIYLPIHWCNYRIQLKEKYMQLTWKQPYETILSINVNQGYDYVLFTIV